MITLWHPTPYALVLVITGLLAGAAALYTWQRRCTLGAAAGLALLGMAFWSAGYGVALGLHELPARIFWAKVQYIGIGLLSVAGPVFALRYVGLTRWLRPPVLLALAVTPAIGLALAWTNEQHGLIWAQLRLKVVDGLALLDIDYGPYFYFYSVYNYALVILTALIFLLAALRAAGLQRRQAWIVFAGSAIPALAILVQIAGLSPVANLDLIPFGYSLAALSITFGLVRYRLFDVVPVARALVLEEMHDAVLVLDAQDRLVDHNPAAHSLLAAHGAAEADITVGMRLPPVLLAAIPTGGTAGWHVETQAGRREYQIAVTPLPGDSGASAGRVVVFHDVTELAVAHRALEETQRRASEQQQILAVFEERERLGRDLHDGLGQVVAYVHVQAQAVRALLDQGQQAAAQEALKQLEEAAGIANADLRAHLLGVRSARLDSAPDFFEALARYLVGYEASGGIHVDLAIDPGLPRTAPFAPEASAQLLYIIQEALTNTRKHAGVSRARLDFVADGDHALVTIADAGSGFDPAAHISAPGAHFGLAVMAERAQSVGGALQVHTAPGRGVQIEVVIPLALAAMLPGAEDGLAVKELRVLLVDDHPLFLDGMRTLLTAHGVQVVGMAHDGVEAQELAAELQPALILMDVHMPVCDGLEATRRIHAGWPAIKIVMLTLAADEASLYQAMAAGAWGYLLKNMDSVTFVRALAEIVRGEVSLTPALAAQILTAFPTPACSEPGTALSEQQVRVLELVARGLLYKEVARALAISEATVKYHMGQIVDHLHVKNRAEAVAIARQRWLIERT